MKIGLDLQATYGPVSGIGAYAQGLAQALERWGGGHTYLPLHYQTWRRWPAPAELARTQLGLVAEGRRHRLDLIHSPGFAPPLWGRARSVFTVHDLSVREHPELLPAGPSRLYWGQWMSFAARHADCLVVPSRFTAARLQAVLGVPQRRIRHVPYPPRTRFSPASAQRQAEMREVWNLPRPYVLGLGASEPRKDWPAVVRAFALLAPECDLDLVLAGGVNVGASEAALQAEIARSNVGARVRRLGYVATEWLPALYTAAACFVFPETYAGYGLPVLEAMACDTPVLTFSNTALPEVAGDAALLVAPPYRPEEIAAALRALIHDAALRAELRRRGRARVAELDWATTARAMVAIFEEFAC